MDLKTRIKILFNLRNYLKNRKILKDAGYTTSKYGYILTHGDKVTIEFVVPYYYVINGNQNEINWYISSHNKTI